MYLIRIEAEGRVYSYHTEQESDARMLAVTLTLAGPFAPEQVTIWRGAESIDYSQD